MSSEPKTIYLSEYQPPNYDLNGVDLTFEIFSGYTVVRSILDFSQRAERPNSIELFGIDIELQSLTVNAVAVADELIERTAESIILKQLPSELKIEVVGRIEPEKNTALEGLYKSSVMYCTQCEAEGFRRITYFPDRPDVLSTYRVRIEADKASCPVLLSNGNLTDSGQLSNGRHYAVWEDPHAKPSYLFALVAGDLEHVSDSFTTMSGVDVDLRMYVEAKDLDKCDFAMESLKRSMKWDEEAYGREYDLDIFNIVAVDDFNMGAMENKSLNIFNTSCVLARPETTTDATFQRIEGIVGHEYFHNWSGNRVTCRDWFQLSLKEGFTVYRDAQFSSDMGSPAIKRIEDVALLRARQFAEDAGPLAHPVRPASFIEISNFYTLTVYEKGAEVVGMIHRLLGDEAFRRGSDLYFENNDGKAATIEDFIAAMTQASGRDFSQFMNWYSQAGTPMVQVEESYDDVAQTYRLTLRQSCRATAECEHKQPYVIPVELALLGDAGALPLSVCAPDVEDNTVTVLEFTESEQTFEFTGVKERPVISIFRELSAPVTIDFSRPREDLLFLIAKDNDPVSAWDAAQQLLTQEINRAMAEPKAYEFSKDLVDALRTMLLDEHKEPALKAYMLMLPSEAILQQGESIDPLAIAKARELVFKKLAGELNDEFVDAYHAQPIYSEYAVNAEQVGGRLLRNTLLSYLASSQEGHELALEQYGTASNMTDELSALRALNRFSEHAPLAEFYTRWKDETLVLNSWFEICASASANCSLATIISLTEHEAFDFANPNKVRSLLGGFTANTNVFHAVDGSGYEFLGDMVIKLDRANPQLASRITGPLTTFKRYTSTHADLMRQVLERILESGDISKDLYEVVSKSLQDG